MTKSEANNPKVTIENWPDELMARLWGIPFEPLDDRERRVILEAFNEAIESARAEALEEAANVAKVSADYYAKGAKREDGTLNTTIASAAQTSWDIHRAVLALSPARKAR